jgi:hypothetical protein
MDRAGNRDLGAIVRSYEVRATPERGVWMVYVFYTSAAPADFYTPKPQPQLEIPVAVADLVAELGPIPAGDGDGALEFNAEGGFKFRPRQRSMN